jgi:hypothetical protein
MQLLFFDIVSPKCRSYDYHGRKFSSPEDAAELAETIAMDLGCSETADWAGSQVQVRTATGDMLFFAPVVMAA